MPQTPCRSRSRTGRRIHIHQIRSWQRRSCRLHSCGRPREQDHGRYRETLNEVVMTPDAAGSFGARLVTIVWPEEIYRWRRGKELGIALGDRSCRSEASIGSLSEVNNHFVLTPGQLVWTLCGSVATVSAVRHPGGAPASKLA